jgi:hypothetical protein
MALQRVKCPRIARCATLLSPHPHWESRGAYIICGSNPRYVIRSHAHAWREAFGVVLADHVRSYFTIVCLLPQAHIMVLNVKYKRQALAGASSSFKFLRNGSHATRLHHKLAFHRTAVPRSPPTYKFCNHPHQAAALPEVKLLLRKLHGRADFGRYVIVYT